MNHMYQTKPVYQLMASVIWLLISGSVKAESVRQLFEADKISSAAIEYGISFAPDGKTLYFARASGQWGKNNGTSTIYQATKTKGQWSEPVVAAFSGQYDDSDPHISADGMYLFFVSDRPSNNHKRSADIWVLTQGDDGTWHDLRRLPEPINSDQTEYSPRTTAQGDLYFASDRPNGFGQGDLYWSKKLNTGYGSVENLGPAINAATGEWNLEINEQGDILIFEASGRAENQSGAGDLYISFKLDEYWSKPQNLIELNSPGSDLYPELIADHTLYYASNDQAGSYAPEVYKVDFKPMLQRYREKAKKISR